MAPLQHHLEHGIRQIHAEGQGCWRLAIVTRSSTASLVSAAEAGDALAIIVLRAAEQFMEHVYARRSPDHGPLCLLCNTKLSRDAPPGAVGIMSAYRDDARTALGHGFCAACVAARSEAQLGQDVVAKLRAEMMPSLRILPTPSRPGHA
jgi:hypothetical protein